MCVMFCGCCEKDWGAEEEGLPQEQREFVNQAVKAIAVARGYTAPLGIDLVCVPCFYTVEIEGEKRTAMRFIVRKEAKE